MERRSRIHRTPSGKRLALTARDLELFKLFARYRFLRATYLHAFVGGASATRFKERLGDLFHEGYLDRPQQQWTCADARYRSVVHAIGAKGVLALRLGATEPSDPERRLMASASPQFLHSLMICETLASIELAVRATCGLRFIAWPEILAKAPEATRTIPRAWRFPIPSHGFVAPDAMFGIEYQIQGTKKYRFFALEADRGTMPISRSKPGQTSYYGKLAAYDCLLAQQVHKSHLGIPNLLVLTLTTSAVRMTGIIAGLGTRSPAFLFKAAEEKALDKPVQELLLEPWRRAGHPPLSINASS